MVSPPQLPEHDYEAMPAEGILATFLDAFPGRVSLACSFQKQIDQHGAVAVGVGADQPFGRARRARMPDAQRSARSGSALRLLRLSIPGPTLHTVNVLSGRSAWSLEPGRA